MKNILIVFLSAFMLFSCATATLDSRVKKIELGMDKKKVVKIMGKTYNSSGAVKTSEGNLETIKYANSTTSGYTFQFLNDKLVKWDDGVNKNLRPRPRPWSYK